MVGMNALAALGATGAIFFLIIGSVMGLTTGFSIITAQRFGAGDEEGVRRSLAMSILLCIFFTVLLTAISVLTARPLLSLMNTPADIFEDAWLYIVIIYAGLGASMYYNLVANVLRALGDGKTPLYFLIFSSILNVVLDIYLIKQFHMALPALLLQLSSPSWFLPSAAPCLSAANSQFCICAQSTFVWIKKMPWPICM